MLDISTTLGRGSPKIRGTTREWITNKYLRRISCKHTLIWVSLCMKPLWWCTAPILVRQGWEKYGSLRIKGCIRQHSCSFHVQKSVSRTSPSRFQRRGVEFKRDGTKLIFWQWHQRRWLLLCLKCSMFEVFWRQWSGRASSLLLRSGDDYQLLSAANLWNNCQHDMWIMISLFHLLTPNQLWHLNTSSTTPAQPFISLSSLWF